MTDKPILTPFMESSGITLYQGDCIDTMRRLPDNSVDAIITDPPYGLEFMGKDWDGFGTPLGFQTWTQAWAEEAYRVLKPGGHLLAFAGTRTYHRMASGVEDAGFEIRDCIAWMYGSGFPKSLDVSKAIDKQRYDREDIYKVTAWVREARDAAGITNRDIDDAFGFAGMAGHWTSSKSQPAVPTLDQVPALLEVLGVTPEDVPEEIRRLLWDLNGRKGQPGENWAKREVIGRGKSAIANKEERPRHTVGSSQAVEFDITAPATPAAAKWSGWGTALKPAHEPIVVARKPLIGTVAQNVLEHGTGALNIDKCRISTADKFGGGAKGTSGFAAGYEGDGWQSGSDLGRWPANVVLDEEAGAMLDQQSGYQKDGTAVYRNLPETGGSSGQIPISAPKQRGRDMTYGGGGGASRFFYCAKASKKDRNTNGAANTHPTVKPTELMRWLIRLVTPPGGIILDPFGGSGSTGVAAQAENVRCILIEREDDYVQIIRDRLSDEDSLFSQLP
jgi:DNA modification methylase